MVFTRLSDNDKHAFFELLDEYFASRPEIFSSSNDTDASSDAAKPVMPSNASNMQGRAASAVTHALASNPEATASLISSGLRHSAKANAESSAAGGVKSPQSSMMAAASRPEVANSVGRVAAAALTFGHNKSTSTKPPAPPPPPAFPHRSPSSYSNRSLSPSAASSYSAHSPPAPPPAPPPPPSHSLPSHKTPATPPAGLVSKKSIGNIDTTSFSRSVITMATKPKPPPTAPPQKPAFQNKLSGIAPPPVRRVTPDGGGTGAPPPLPRRQIEPEPEPEPEPEEEVIWAEALYDYESTEPGDLRLRAKQRVKITEKDSDDWWTGEVDGRSGLFPAAYVKLL